MHDEQLAASEKDFFKTVIVDFKRLVRSGVIFHDIVGINIQRADLEGPSPINLVPGNNVFSGYARTRQDQIHPITGHRIVLQTYAMTANAEFFQMRTSFNVVYLPGHAAGHGYIYIVNPSRGMMDELIFMANRTDVREEELVGMQHQSTCSFEVIDDKIVSVGFASPFGYSEIKYDDGVMRREAPERCMS